MSIDEKALRTVWDLMEKSAKVWDSRQIIEAYEAAKASANDQPDELPEVESKSRAYAARVWTQINNGNIAQQEFMDLYWAHFVLLYRPPVRESGTLKAIRQHEMTSENIAWRLRDASGQASNTTKADDWLAVARYFQMLGAMVLDRDRVFEAQTSGADSDEQGRRG